jgi:hypothetical protein
MGTINNLGYDNCALLGYYAASSGNFFTTFRDNPSVPSSGEITAEDGADRLFQNVDKNLLLFSA